MPAVQPIALIHSVTKGWFAITTAVQARGIKADCVVWVIDVDPTSLDRKEVEACLNGQRESEVQDLDELVFTSPVGSTDMCPHYSQYRDCGYDACTEIFFEELKPMHEFRKKLRKKHRKRKF